MQTGLAGLALVSVPGISNASSTAAKLPVEGVWDYIVSLSDQAMPYLRQGRSGCTADGFEFRNQGRSLQLKTDGGLVNLNHDAPYGRLFKRGGPTSVALSSPFGKRELFENGFYSEHAVEGFPQKTAHYAFSKDRDGMLRLRTVNFSSNGVPVNAYSIIDGDLVVEGFAFKAENLVPKILDYDTIGNNFLDDSNLVPALRSFIERFS